MKIVRPASAIDLSVTTPTADATVRESLSTQANSQSDTPSLFVDGKPDPSLLNRQLDVLNASPGAKHEIALGEKTLTVMGTDAEGTQAIAREFERLAQDNCANVLPNDSDRAASVYVLDDATYQHLAGAPETEYPARYITDGKNYHLVVPQSLVNRSRNDGKALRMAILPALYQRSPYIASVLEGPLKGKLLRGSTLTPELLRAATDTHSFDRVINLRLEDPDGDVDRLMIEKENDRRRDLGMLPIKYLYIPIKDYGVPTPEQEQRLVEVLSNLGNQRTFVHCKMGVGRTGLVTAMAEIITGSDSESAIQRNKDWFTDLKIQMAPDATQTRYLEDFAQRWKTLKRDS